MKKLLLTLLTAVLVIGVLAGAGYAGYRIGYSHGALASASGKAPPAGHLDNFGSDRPLGRDFDRGFNRSFPPGGFRMMRRGPGFCIFFPIMFLGRIAIWSLIIWLLYSLFTRGGWRLSLTKQPVQNPPANIETEMKPGDQKSENE